jgi:hypothetical protein
VHIPRVCGKRRNREQKQERAQTHQTIASMTSLQLG